MTKGYKENVIRMFDSIRSEHKGEENCAGVACYDCPFFEKICNMGGIIRRHPHECVENIGRFVIHPYETIEIVENWVKEHPVVTNAMKFEEVFNIPSDIELTCINMDKNCVKCVYYNDGECPVNNWWNSPYKEKKGK